MLGFDAISEDPISALPDLVVVVVVVVPAAMLGRTTEARLQQGRVANASLSQQRGVSSGLNSRRASAPLLRK